MAKRMCSVEGCGRPVKGLGWCKRHLDWFKAYCGGPLVAPPHRGIAIGTPITTGPIPEYRPDLGPCWLWGGRRDKQGYASANIGSGDARRKVGVHRWVYEAITGPIPDGLVLDHLCRVRSCCNPAHLEPVTGAENVRRGSRMRTGEPCSRNHPISMSVLNKIGRTVCMECQRLRMREFHARKKESPRPSLGSSSRGDSLPVPDR